MISFKGKPLWAFLLKLSSGFLGHLEQAPCYSCRSVLQARLLPPLAGPIAPASLAFSPFPFASLGPLHLLLLFPGMLLSSFSARLALFHSDLSSYAGGEIFPDHLHSHGDLHLHVTTTSQRDAPCARPRSPLSTWHCMRVDLLLRWVVSSA